ncbi:MAG: tetratricopeptide repeat protein [Acidobacteriia bacterium]|nr:tetratricopeptide repeat protein [Terriglobia bacterium]
MAAAQQNGQALRDELERVLSSSCFARAERVSKLLRFVVEQQLEGRENELKESIIGVEVFGRRPDYDTKQDSTVRTEALRLRERLSRYYSTEGVQGPFVIELPKGGYVPTFRRPEQIPLLQKAKPKRLLRLAACLAGCVVAATALGVWWAVHKTATIPIAVLPLVNLSQDPANDYLADGLTSEIISELSMIEGLAVRSQTSSFALKGKPRNVHEAGSQLQADYILEGSILRDGQHVRINARLVRVRDDIPIWSRIFEPEWTDVLSVQNEISRGIVNSLRLNLGRGRRRYETNEEAYDLYLHARASMTRLFPGNDEVIGLFEKAIAKDSSLAPAYAGLAAAYAWKSFSKSGDLNRDEKLQKMQAAAEAAIRLDPLLAEAHSALGTAYANRGQWKLAEQSFRRATEIDPNSSTTHGHYSRFYYWPLGRIQEAVQEARAAVRSDPLSPLAHSELCDVLLTAGQYDEAASQFQKMPSDDEWEWGRVCLGRARFGQGRTAEAIQVLSSVKEWGYLAYVYVKSGRLAEAEKLIAEAPILHPDRRGPHQLALVFAGFGDRDHTIERLERLARVGPVRLGFTLNSPEFAFVRGDPRLKTLREKMGLPE